LKAAKKKRQVTYKAKPIRIAAEFSNSKYKKTMGRHNSGPEKRKQQST
jgi:hypothetical protein